MVTLKHFIHKIKLPFVELVEYSHSKLFTIYKKFPQIPANYGE